MEGGERREFPNRKNEYKKTSIFHTSQKRVEESQRICRDEREKTFAAKRQKATETHMHSQLQNVLHLPVVDILLKIQDLSCILEKQMQAEDLTCKDGETTCMDEKSTCMDEKPTWMDEKTDGGKTRWDDLLTNLKCLCLLLSFSIANVQESLNKGCVGILKICLDGGLRYKKEGVVYECVGCVGNIALMATELPENLIVTFLDSMNVVLLNDSSLSLIEHAVWCFGNLSAHFAAQISSSDTLRIALILTHKYGEKFTAETAGLMRILTWLLSNLFRSLHEDIAYKAVGEWRAAHILTSLIKAAASPLEEVSSHVPPSSEGGGEEVSKTDAKFMRHSAGELSVTDDRRGAAGEALWGAVYLASIHHSIAVEFFKEGICGSVLTLIEDVIRSTKNYNEKKRTEGEKGGGEGGKGGGGGGGIFTPYICNNANGRNTNNTTSNSDICMGGENGGEGEENKSKYVCTSINNNNNNNSNIMGGNQTSGNTNIIPSTNINTANTSVLHAGVELLETLRTTGVDILVPAITILSCIVSASLSTGEAYLSESLISAPNFREILSVLLTYHHRGIVCEAAAMVAQLAAGSSACGEFVFPLCCVLGRLLEFPGSFDIKREAGIGIVHMCLNHEQRFMRELLSREPSIFDNMLALLEGCKYDRTTVIVALDFVEGVARFFPNGKRILYDKGVIDKMEGAQFMHDGYVERRIGIMVEKYFDEVDEDENEDI